MKIKFLCLFLLGLAIASCKENASTETQDVDQETEVAMEDTEEDPILLGLEKRNTLESEPYLQWFEESYKNHSIDSATIAQVKPMLLETDITIFMGTWCEDSQRETPAFYKILDQAGYNSDNVRLITVSEDKDTPQGLEEGKNITNVPTIIFYKNGEELGRIVEYPLESLEKDMAKILKGEAYKHAYAE